MTNTPRLLFIGPGMPAVRARLEKSFEVLDLPADETKDFLAAHGAGIKAVATFRGIAPDVMGALPDLKVISSFGVGYDSIDTRPMF